MFDIVETAIATQAVKFRQRSRIVVIRATGLVTLAFGRNRGSLNASICMKESDATKRQRRCTRFSPDQVPELRCSNDPKAKESDQFEVKRQIRLIRLSRVLLMLMILGDANNHHFAGRLPPATVRPQRFRFLPRRVTKDAFVRDCANYTLKFCSLLARMTTIAQLGALDKHSCLVLVADFLGHGRDVFGATDSVRTDPP